MFENTISTDELLRRLTFVENQLNGLNQTLQNYYVQGRLRTDRAAPANSAEVYPNLDLLGDRVITDTYEYILVNNAGTLNWVRLIAATF